eukprot:PLAT10115.2.p1 GENE.PLAT10115.2~~PLAT10115.2.p1  ORF type:complete len:275 (-),score=52.46 PLAT10115.2:55-807(-)
MAAEKDAVVMGSGSTDDAAAVSYTLRYFNLRFRSEPIRLLLEVAAQSYAWETVELADWRALKPTTPFGSLPLLTDHMEADLELAQTDAISRYIARKHGLYGADLKQAALIDAFVSHTRDGMAWIISRMLFVPPEEFDARKDVVQERNLMPWLEAIEKGLARNRDSGGRFLVGEGFTLADAAVFSLLDNVLGPLWPSVLRSRDSIINYVNSMRALPAIAAYYASGRRPAVSCGLLASALNTPDKCRWTPEK